MQRDMDHIGIMLRATQYENVRLRNELQALKDGDLRSAFETPEEDKEEGHSARQVLFKEDGAREAHQDRTLRGRGQSPTRAH